MEKAQKMKQNRIQFWFFLRMLSGLSGESVSSVHTKSSPLKSKVRPLLESSSMMMQEKRQEEAKDEPQEVQQPPKHKRHLPPPCAQCGHGNHPNPATATEWHGSLWRQWQCGWLDSHHTTLSLCLFSLKDIVLLRWLGLSSHA